MADCLAGCDTCGKNRGILDLILFLAAINLTLSPYNAALPAMLPGRGGGQAAFGPACQHLHRPRYG